MIEKMENYIIRYRIQTETKERRATASVLLDSKETAIELARQMEEDGFYVEEVHNHTKKVELYHHKKARFNHVLDRVESDEV